MQDIHGTGVNNDSIFGEYKENLMCTRTQGKAVPHRRLNQTYLLVLEGFLQRHQYAMVHHGDGAPAATVLDGAPCLEALLKISSSHAIKPADSRARLPQAKQLIGREHSPTHQ